MSDKSNVDIEHLENLVPEPRRRMTVKNNSKPNRSKNTPNPKGVNGFLHITTLLSFGMCVFILMCLFPKLVWYFIVLWIIYMAMIIKDCDIFKTIKLKVQKQIAKYQAQMDDDSDSSYSTYADDSTDTDTEENGGSSYTIDFDENLKVSKSKNPAEMRNHNWRSKKYINKNR